jgi:nitrate reductase assembly molybdenum cofactor insertion protein NarJ
MELAPRTLDLLARVAAYPGDAIHGDATRCAEALAASHPGAAARLARFAAFARDRATAEEAYTSAFDLAPLTSPYVGDQLFGESRERALLMAWLRELQRDAGVVASAELPDHVSEVLRLLAAELPSDVRADLAQDALVPSAGKMLAALEGARHPYADVLGAVVDVLQAFPLTATLSSGRGEGEHARRRLEVIP